MTADQLTMLEKQYLERNLLEKVEAAPPQPLLHALNFTALPFPPIPN